MIVSDTLDEFLSQIFANQWSVIALVSLLLLVSAEIGFRFGKRSANTEANHTHLTTIQASILGMLALIIGFTFAMALHRYETRRDLVLQEANAIGTAYLRASFLPPTQSGPVKQALRQYLDIRIPLYSPKVEAAKVTATEKESSELQRGLWTQTVEAALAVPSAVTATFITSLNEVIDLDESRLHALRSHVPGAAWLLVLTISAVACYVTGYAAGSNGTRSALATISLPVLIAIVITLVADLDRPRRGIIGISNKPLLDLQQSIRDSDHSVEER